MAIQFRQKKRKWSGTKRSNKKRRTTFRRRRSGRAGLKPVKTLNPVPMRRLMRLRYTETVTLALSAGVLNIFRFVSSLHDPNQTGTGHQPLWRDQLGAMYQKYRIHGIKYRIKMINGINSVTQTAILHRSSLNPNGTTSFDTECERVNCVRKRMMTALGTTGSTCFMKGYLNCHKVEGTSKGEYNTDDSFEGNLGPLGSTSPNRTSFLEIDTVSAAGGTVIMMAELVFYTDLFGPVQVGQS